MDFKVEMLKCNGQSLSEKLNKLSRHIKDTRNSAIDIDQSLRDEYLLNCRQLKGYLTNNFITRYDQEKLKSLIGK